MRLKSRFHVLRHDAKNYPADGVAALTAVKACESSVITDCLAQEARALRKSKQQSSRKRPSGIDSLSDDQLDSLSEDQLRQFGLLKIKPTLLLDPALLQSWINDPHLGVRRTVIQALGACGAEAIHAVPLLKPLLDDPKNVIRKVAMDGLKSIQP